MKEMQGLPDGAYFFGPLKFIAYEGRISYFTIFKEGKIKSLSFLGSGTEDYQEACVHGNLEVLKRFKFLDFRRILIPSLSIFTWFLKSSIENGRLNLVRFLLSSPQGDGSFYSLVVQPSLSSFDKHNSILETVKHAFEVARRAEDSELSRRISSVVRFLVQNKHISLTAEWLEALAFYGHISLFRYALEQGLGEKNLAEQGGRILLSAVKSNSLAKVSFLLDLEVPASEQTESLVSAALEGDIRIIKALVAKGAKIEESSLEEADSIGDWNSLIYLTYHYDKQGFLAFYASKFIHNQDYVFVKDLTLKGYILASEPYIKFLSNCDNLFFIKYYVAHGVDFILSKVSFPQDKEIRAFGALGKKEREAQASRFLRSLYVRDILLKL